MQIVLRPEFLLRSSSYLFCQVTQLQIITTHKLHITPYSTLQNSDSVKPLAMKTSVDIIIKNIPRNDNTCNDLLSNISTPTNDMVE